MEKTPEQLEEERAERERQREIEEQEEREREERNPGYGGGHKRGGFHGDRGNRRGGRSRRRKY